MPQTTIYIGKDLYQLVLKACEKENKTISKWIQQAITEQIARVYTGAKKK